jgi:SAM-dependent methyltransferase
VTSPGPGGFDRIAARYDDHRPVDANWWALFDRIVELGDLNGRRVLEVGSGTGRLAEALTSRAGTRVFAIDASQAMVEQARARGVNVRLGRAEALPFKRGWFDAAVMRMVAHLLDRSRALPEVARVLGVDGRLVVATADPAGFDRAWFARYFPSVPAVDRRRFPTAEVLATEIAAAGLSTVRVERLRQWRTITRAKALDLISAKAYSTFDLIATDEYDAGLARATIDLPDELHYSFDWLLAVGSR